MVFTLRKGQRSLFKMKILAYQNTNCHCRDSISARLSYRHNENIYTDDTLALQTIDAWWCVCVSEMGYHLTHWGRVTHLCISKLTIIGSNNGLSSPGWCQAIIWTNAGILLIQPLGTHFSEILSKIHSLPFKKIRLKMAVILPRPQCVNGLAPAQCHTMTWTNIDLFSMGPLRISLSGI